MVNQENENSRQSMSRNLFLNEAKAHSNTRGYQEQTSEVRNRTQNYNNNL